MQGIPHQCLFVCIPCILRLKFPSISAMARTKELFANLLLPAHSDLIGIAHLFQSGRTKLNLQVPVVVLSHPVVGAEPVYVQLLLHPFEHVKCLARQEMSRMVTPQVIPSFPKAGLHKLWTVLLS